MQKRATQLTASVLSFLFTAMILFGGYLQAPASAESLPPAASETARPKPSVPEEGFSGMSRTPRRLPEIIDDDLPEEVLGAAEEKGRVEVVEYTAHDQVFGSSSPVVKKMAVYLPFGYEEEGKYDVLMLLHTAGADHRFWLVEERDYATGDRSIRLAVPDLLDILIEKGYCRPVIVVSPCIYLNGYPGREGSEADYLQFEREIGSDLLPWIAEHYATYAADESRAALTKARDHFGVLGASFGAYTVYISLLGDNFDLFSKYCLCGGGVIEPWHLEERWEYNGTQDLPLGFLYIAEGEYDDREGPELSYIYMRAYGGKFTEENVRFTLIRGYGHEDHSYVVGLFNALQLFFPPHRS